MTSMMPSEFAEHALSREMLARDREATREGGGEGAKSHFRLHRCRGLFARQAEPSEREAIQNIIERVARQIADANHSQDVLDRARGVVAVRCDEFGARGWLGLHVRLRPVLGVQQRGEFTFRRAREHAARICSISARLMPDVSATCA